MVNASATVDEYVPLMDCTKDPKAIKNTTELPILWTGQQRSATNYNNQLYQIDAWPLPHQGD